MLKRKEDLERGNKAEKVPPPTFSFFFCLFWMDNWRTCAGGRIQVTAIALSIRQAQISAEHLALAAFFHTSLFLYTCFMNN